MLLPSSAVEGAKVLGHPVDITVMQNVHLVTLHFIRILEYVIALWRFFTFASSTCLPAADLAQGKTNDDAPAQRFVIFIYTCFH